MSGDDQSLTPFESPVDSLERPDPEVGQWFWVKDDDQGDYLEGLSPIGAPGPEPMWFGCISKIGSNFVELRSPDHKYGHSTIRVLLEHVDRDLIFEPNHTQIIAQTLAHFQKKANDHLAEVKQITSRLGVSPRVGITNLQEESGTSLVVLSETPDPDAYKNQLVKAHEEDLPDLFEKIRHANEAVASWMAAEMIPLIAESKGLQKVLGQIEKRIFNVSLYAGLTEQVSQIRDGDPAHYDEKICLMQRMLFMDEECLVNYQAGGMSFNDISQFDQWLSEEENLNQCLPFPRCVALFRVRRNVKDYNSLDDGRREPLDAFIKFHLEAADRLTFMYLRNGDQLYRLSSELEFGLKMFPDKDANDFSKPMVVRMNGDSVKKFKTRSSWEVLLEEAKAEYEKNKALSEQWEKDNPDTSWVHNPYGGGVGRAKGASRYEGLKEYQPFDSSHPYFDEASAELSETIEQFNRIALILQGILDRSPIMHPHPPVKSWLPEDFERTFELIYDGSNVIPNGEPPDFEKYRAQLNATADANSIFIGQEDYWAEQEAIKECDRRDRDWRDRSNYRPRRYRPYGNPGPADPGPCDQFKPRACKAKFSWQRQRMRWQRYGDNAPVTATITVPLDRLFNVSAYKAGDFKRFYQDHRTRADYLKWAPYLLAAEDYVNGKANKDSEA